MSHKKTQTPHGALLASVLLLACHAGVAIRGAPSHYAQSLDSASSSCRTQPWLCARMAGEETVVPQGAQRLAEFGASALGAAAVLDNYQRSLIEQDLTDCANQARTKVLLEHMDGRSPTPAECLERGNFGGKVRTRAQYFGEEMHKAALECAGLKLNELRPGGFSLEPRYRYDKATFISEEEAQSLLRQRRGDELRGTLRPDVVIHSGGPLQVRAVYDFKFPCADSGRPTPWTRYTEGPNQGFDQKQVYWTALKVEPFRVVPWLGILQ